jgi:hypothetical protein
MSRYTIAVAVRYASRKINRSKHRWPDGKLQATRKNPCVIDVDLDHDIQLSCWFIMWMVT